MCALKDPLICRAHGWALNKSFEVQLQPVHGWQANQDWKESILDQDRTDYSSLHEEAIRAQWQGQREDFTLESKISWRSWIYEIIMRYFEYHQNRRHLLQNVLRNKPVLLQVAQRHGGTPGCKIIWRPSILKRGFRRLNKLSKSVKSY